MKSADYQMVQDAYGKYRPLLLTYILNRIDNKEEAEDMVHDCFLKLLESSMPVREATIGSYLFSIARNLVFDHFRYQQVCLKYNSYIYDQTDVRTVSPEKQIVERDLLHHAALKIAEMPPQRQRIYRLVRLAGNPMSVVAEKLNLSLRTVQNHLFMASHEVRDYMRQCV